MATLGSSLQKPEDGTALVIRGTGASSSIGQLSGVVKSLTRAEFDKIVADERSRISANTSGIYQAGEIIGRIIGELGERSWTLGTGGTNAANASASHARAVAYLGKTYTLAADANVFGVTTGAPASGTGANGDIVVDSVAGVLYGPKASGAWPAGVSLAALPNTSALTLADITALTGTGAAARASFALNSVRIITSPGPVTILPGDGLVKIAKTVAEATAVTLEGSPVIGAVHTIKDGTGTGAAYPITINGPIDGQQSYVLNVNRGAITLEFDGVEWSSI